MSNAPRIAIPNEAIAEFCRRHHIRQLSLFGSVLRDDFTDESDVDVLVEFEAGHVPGFFRFSNISSELSDLLGRKVDLLTGAELGSRLSMKVMSSRLLVYDAA